MRETRAEKVPLVVHEDLRLVFEPAKCCGMNNAIAVTLKFSACAGRRFGIPATTRLRRVRCVGGEVSFERSPCRRRGQTGSLSAVWMSQDVAAPFSHRVLQSWAATLRVRSAGWLQPADRSRQMGAAVAASVARTASSGASVISVSPNCFSRMNLIAPASAFLSTFISSI